MANLERIYTIPLGEVYGHVRNKRGKRAVKLLKEFAQRHMKAEAVKISEGTNSAILRDGIQKPPRRLKVRIVKNEEGVAKVWLIGEEEKLRETAEKKKKEEEVRRKEAEKKQEKKEQKAPSAPAAQSQKMAASQSGATAGAAQSPGPRPEYPQSASSTGPAARSANVRAKQAADFARAQEATKQSPVQKTKQV